MSATNTVIFSAAGGALLNNQNRGSLDLSAFHPLVQLPIVYVVFCFLLWLVAMAACLFFDDQISFVETDWWKSPAGYQQRISQMLVWDQWSGQPFRGLLFAGIFWAGTLAAVLAFALTAFGAIGPAGIETGFPK